MRILLLVIVYIGAFCEVLASPIASATCGYVIEDGVWTLKCPPTARGAQLGQHQHQQPHVVETANEKTRPVDVEDAANAKVIKTFR